MPTRKLTLSVEADAIDNGRRYATITGRSISAIVSDYLESLDTTPPAHRTTPEVARLRGIGKGTRPVTEDDYLRHLEEKYL